MSMTTYVTGISPPDNEFKKKLAAWEACKAAGVGIPDELDDYFGGETPNPLGSSKYIAAQESSSDSANHWTVELATLPPHVKFLRFSNSY